MVNAKIAGQSRWVLRSLWLIAAALVVTILVIRNKGILTEPELLHVGNVNDASQAFALPPVSNSGSPHSLDVIAWSDHVPVRIRPGVSVTVVAGTTLTITGWAFDAAANADYPAIGAKVSGSSTVYSALVHLARPDVAAALRNSAAGDTGFTLNIDTSHLTLGRHAVAIHALSPDRNTFVLLKPAIAIDIADQSTAAQHTDAIDAVNGVVVNAAASASAPIALLRSYGTLSISGWGFVTSGTRLPSGVTILVDGNPAGAARYGLPRPDIARQFHDVRVTRSGFQGTVQTESLAPGEHKIQLRLGLSDGTSVPSVSALHIDLH
jgi:hypothetical protein